jgi:hypothetical protein
MHCKKKKKQTSVSTGRDVPRGIPGQSGTERPVIPLSWDKEIFLSQCPFFPGQGQEQMSGDVPGQNHLPKNNQKTGKRHSKTGKGRSKTGKGRSKTGKDVLKQEKYVLKQEKMF